MSHYDVPVSSLTRDEAVRIYTGKTTTWPDGQPIVVVILPRDSYVSREFIFDWLRLTPYQFYDSINIATNKKQNSIIKVCCEAEVIKQVAKTPGSIGYTSDFIYMNYESQVKKISIK